MEPEVEVLHFLLARETRIDESWRSAVLSQPASLALRGVGYSLRVNADVEFPTDAKPPGEVYLRLRGIGCGPRSLLLQTAHCDPRGIWTRHSFIPVRTANPVPFSEVFGEVHDLVVQLPYLRIGGPGLNWMSVSFFVPGTLSVDHSQDEPTTMRGWVSEFEDLFEVPGCLFGAVDSFWAERTT